MSRPPRILMALAALALAASGCDDGSTDPVPTGSARVRVVHAAPDLGEVDVYFRGETAPWFADLAYRGASTYRTSRPPREVVLEFRAGGADPGDAPLFTADALDQTAGGSTTVLVAGLAGSAGAADSLRALFLQDGWQAHVGDETRARVVHAGADAPPVTVAIAGGDTLAEDLARFADSGLGGRPYPGGEVVELLVYGPSGFRSFRLPPLAADGGHDLVLTGRVDGAGGKPLTVFAVGPGGAVDALPAYGKEMRLVHAAPNLATVDAYLVWGLGTASHRTLMLADMAYGDATVYGTPVDRTPLIRLYPTGGDPATSVPLHELVFTLTDADTSHTVFLLGDPDAAEPDGTMRPVVVADEFATPPLNNLSVRFVHAAPGLGTLEFDVGDDGTPDATLARFAVGASRPFPGGTTVPLAVRAGGGLQGLFATPRYTAGVDHYLLITGYPGGGPPLELLSIAADGSLGFTAPDGG